MIESKEQENGIRETYCFNMNYMIGYPVQHGKQQITEKLNHQHNKMKPTHKDVWLAQHESGLTIEIVHWGIDREQPEFEPLNNGKGVWNYYIYIYEKLLSKEKFETLWLPDKIVRFSTEGSEHITHDYYDLAVCNLDWHGGVTFYRKHGQTVGHRYVQIGCDYSHIWDADRGYDYDLDFVFNEAKETLLQVVNFLELENKKAQ